MARPTRQGVDYFPLDIHLDDKFKFIEIKFGLKGFAVIIKLLQKIYSCGYWYIWEEDEVLIFAHENNIDIDLLSQIVQESVERDIFDKSLYEQHRILTSSGIQKRYKEIVRRRKDVEVIEEYLLVDSDFGINANIVPTPCEHNDVESTQSKVKESKVKETKEEKPSVELKFNEETIEYKLSNMLYQKILINDDKAKKPNLYKWAEHMDRLIRIDKRNIEDIKSVINYATSDSFWMSNVLSTNKLRQQFPKLILKVKEVSNDAGNRDKLQSNTSKAKEYTRFNAEEAGVTSF